MTYAGDSDLEYLSFTGSGAVPVQAYPNDAGFDLTTSEDTVVPYGGLAEVPCGIRIALEPDYYARIVGRSSAVKRGLLVIEGIIDPGYRGELFVRVWNLGATVQVVRAGERIGQLIPARNEAVRMLPVRIEPSVFDLIPHDGRGTNGLGSTGH